MRPGDWLRYPVTGDPLAPLVVELDGRSYPAFREDDHAMIRCPNLPPGVYRVLVTAGGRQVHTAHFRVS